ncbi:hypothetical protein RUND412_003136 [Rhizina undulata]
MPPRLPSNYPFHRAHFFALRSQFHTFPPSAASNEPTHYETFNVHHAATPADIKKRFYELSKEHHPDRNPNDPLAAKRFVTINTAYAVIGNAKNREKYDRELQQRYGIGHGTTSSTATARTGPAGGRPASGLSKRRTQFYGPPPSFFRNGGWSTFKGKSSSAAGATAGTTGGPASGVGGGGFSFGGSASGMNDNVPHFNYEAKYRQHEQFEQRRASKRAGSRYEHSGGILGRLIAVSSILIMAVTLASYTDSKIEEEKNARLKRNIR